MQDIVNNSGAVASAPPEPTKFVAFNGDSSYMTEEEWAQVKTKEITFDGDSFYMTENEWSQVKQWIADKTQERAMRWWAEQFEVSRHKAAGIINRIQIGIQFGSLT